MLIRIALLASIAALASCGPTPQSDSRLITIDKNQFSEIYPAVWFSPSSGKVVGLTSQSEEAPSDEFEIWIEPDDPEVAISNQLSEDSLDRFGFVPLGNGIETFERAFNLPRSEPEAIIGRLGNELENDDQPVFLYYGKKSNCLIMIEKVDTDEEVITFRWIVLTK